MTARRRPISFAAFAFIATALGGCAQPSGAVAFGRPEPQRTTATEQPVASENHSDSTAHRIDWLQHHAARLRTFEPSDTNFSDLEPLRAAIGNARVVFLGEPSHSTGNIFSGQTRLVKFLHREMGFDVLVFESGLYALTKVWAAVLADHPALDAFRLGVFRIWTAPAEMAPLAAYVAREARGVRPLELAGYDNQLSGSASRDSLVPELQAYIASIGLRAEFLEDSALWAGFQHIHRFSPSSAGDTIPPDPAVQTHFFQRLGALGQAIGRARTDDRSAFWQRVVEGAAIDARATWSPVSEIVFNERDEQGARNLVWLANERYRGRKVIVWLATIHAARNVALIDTRDTSWSYAGLRPAGHHAWQSFGSEMYALGFVALEGESGRLAQRWRIPADQQPEVELEEMLGAAKFDFAFVDYRNPAPGGEWLRGSFVSRPFGNTAMAGPWRSVLDGIVFVRTGTPATWPADSGSAKP